MTEDLLNTPEPDYFTQLVGDDKKFKDAQALAKGKYIADSYINTLESQLDQLRADYEKVREENVANPKLKELIDQMQHERQNTFTPPKVEEKKPVFNPEELESLIDNRLSQREKARKESDNFGQVKKAIEAKLGKDYQEQLLQRVDDLGMSTQELNALAKSNPKAAIRLLNLDVVEAPQQDIFRPVPRSSITSTTMKPTTEKRTWSWYQNLKQTDPKKYYSPETNVQMHNDALRYGQEFEDGDFGAFEKDYRISF